MPPMPSSVTRRQRSCTIQCESSATSTSWHARRPISRPNDVYTDLPVPNAMRKFHAERLVKGKSTRGQVKKITYPVLRQHLVEQFVRLTPEERLLWLNNFLFIMTPDV